MNGKGRILFEIVGGLLVALIAYFFTSASAIKPLAALENRVSIVETQLTNTDDRLDRIELKIDLLLQRP